VGKPAGLSTSMGEASVGGLADVAAAYKWGAAGVGMSATSWEAGGLHIHGYGRCILGVLGGGLALVVTEPRKVKRLPSLLVRGRAWPIRGGVVSWGQERV